MTSLKYVWWLILCVNLSELRVLGYLVTHFCLISVRVFKMRQALESVGWVRQIAFLTWVAAFSCCRSWWNKQVEVGRLQSYVFEWEIQGISLLLLDWKLHHWFFRFSDIYISTEVDMISFPHSETFTHGLKDTIGFPESPVNRGHEVKLLNLHNYTI